MEVALYLFNPVSGQSWFFDAVTRYSASKTWSMTEHPIEGGGVVSDHVQAQPRIITVEAFVSRTPFAGQTYGQPVGTARVTAALAFLRDAGGVPLVIVSSMLGTFQRMVLVRQVSPVEGIGGVKFSLEFKEALIAEAEIVAYTATTNTSSSTSSTVFDGPSEEDLALIEEDQTLVEEEDAGEQGTTTATTTETETSSSYLYDLASYAGVV